MGVTAAGRCRPERFDGIDAHPSEPCRRGPIRMGPRVGTRTCPNPLRSATFVAEDERMCAAAGNRRKRSAQPVFCFFFFCRAPAAQVATALWTGRSAGTGPGPRRPPRPGPVREAKRRANGTSRSTPQPRVVRKFQAPDGADRGRPNVATRVESGRGLPPPASWWGEGPGSAGTPRWTYAKPARPVWAGHRFVSGDISHNKAGPMLHIALELARPLGVRRRACRLADRSPDTGPATRVECGHKASA